MSNMNTGGPAFPFIDSASPLEHPGMTLRDYFAAKALPSILDQKDVHRESELVNAGWIAYKMADIMMKARES